MDNEMIERCKAELERCFAPAIDFKAPYAKVMSDMAIKAIIKAMREPTEKMIAAGAFIDTAQSGVYSCSDVYQSMIDCIAND